MQSSIVRSLPFLDILCNFLSFALSFSLISIYLGIRIEIDLEVGSKLENETF